MKNNTTNLAVAGALSTALFVAASPANAQVEGRGWDEPALSEFTMQDVNTQFTTGEPNVVRDISIDCDLLVRDGQTLFLTTGFAMQFNAETARTEELLGEETMDLLRTWRGQMDFRDRRVQGTATHLSSAHGISAGTLVSAAKTCKQNYFDHAMDIKELGRDLEQIHPDYR